MNQRDASAYYSLRYAFYQLQKYPAAWEAARATTVQAPAQWTPTAVWDKTNSEFNPPYKNSRTRSNRSVNGLGMNDQADYIDFFR